MQLKPLYDRVVVRRLAAETTTESGIVIPDKAAEKSTKGEVIAVGDGRVLENGQRLKPELAVGDRVIFGQYAGTEIKHKGETYLILKETDILAIVDTTQVQEKAA
uniref:co-chaperone GroES n=1 Tax=Ningiella ruwaisensis TaxID=2364274 RepID=UPI00109F97CF|nr:co-chaperone GroES [Ningiella ruwaisensis]